MLIANQWGWFLLNDRRIDVQWSGGDGVADLHIHHFRKPGETGAWRADLLAKSHFGDGILTWTVPYLFRTDPGWSLYVRGPTNWCKDGAAPLDGVVETDWAVTTFTVNWKITRPETWLTFNAGEPISMIFPVRRGGLEEFLPAIEPFENRPELEREYRGWKRGRDEFIARLRGGTAESQWQKHYFRGTTPSGWPFPEHQTKLKLKRFRRRAPAAGSSIGSSTDGGVPLGMGMIEPHAEWGQPSKSVSWLSDRSGFSRQGALPSKSLAR